MPHLEELRCRAGSPEAGGAASSFTCVVLGWDDGKARLSTSTPPWGLPVWPGLPHSMEGSGWLNFLLTWRLYSRVEAVWPLVTASEVTQQHCHHTPVVEVVPDLPPPLNGRSTKESAATFKTAALPPNPSLQFPPLLVENSTICQDCT